MCIVLWWGSIAPHTKTQPNTKHSHCARPQYLPPSLHTNSHSSFSLKWVWKHPFTLHTAFGSSFEEHAAFNLVFALSTSLWLREKCNVISCWYLVSFLHLRVYSAFHFNSKTYSSSIIFWWRQLDKEYDFSLKI